MAAFPADQCFDCLPDSFSRSLDLAVTDMGVTHGHAYIAMPEQAGDDRQGNAVHRRLAGDGVTKVMQAHVLNARFAPHAVSEPGFARPGTGRVPDGGKHPWAAFLPQPASENCLRLSILPNITNVAGEYRPM